MFMILIEWNLNLILNFILMNYCILLLISIQLDFRSDWGKK